MTKLLFPVRTECPPGTCICGRDALIEAPGADLRILQLTRAEEKKMLAKHPTENRDDSRLMVINRAKGTVEHRIFKDIIEYFDEKDLFDLPDNWREHLAKQAP